MNQSTKLRQQAERLIKTADALDAIESASNALDSALESFPRFAEEKHNGKSARGLSALMQSSLVPTLKDGVGRFGEDHD